MVSHSATAILLLTIAVLSSSCMGDNVLYSGNVLNSGSAIQQGSRWLTMQKDCNLVLYDDGYPIWASNTGGISSGCYCTMQSDGNLVVYDQYGNPIWASNTDRGSGNYVLVLQPDRNLVIYGPAIWATATNAVSARLGVNVIYNNVLYSGQSLTQEGDDLKYGNYSLTLQDDCNLVLFDIVDDKLTVIWDAGSGGISYDCYCPLQSDGNLVIYEQDSGNPIWASNTWRESGGNYVLILQPDRNVVIYGTSIWATGTNVGSARLGITPIIATNGTNGRNNTTASVLLMKGGTNETNNTPTI